MTSFMEFMIGLSWIPWNVSFRYILFHEKKDSKRCCDATKLKGTDCRPAKWVWSNMNSMKLVIPWHFISWKKTPNDAVTPQWQSQFTPKMKANAVLRLLPSLVWIDQYNECNRMTSFLEFMLILCFDVPTMCVLKFSKHLKWRYFLACQFTGNFLNTFLKVIHHAENWWCNF